MFVVVSVGSMTHLCAIACPCCCTAVNLHLEATWKMPQRFTPEGAPRVPKGS